MKLGIGGNAMPFERLSKLPRFGILSFTTGSYKFYGWVILKTYIGKTKGLRVFHIHHPIPKKDFGFVVYDLLCLSVFLTTEL